MKFSSILTVLALASSALSIPLAANPDNSLQQRDAALANRLVANSINSFDERAATKPKTVKKPKPKTTKPKVTKPKVTKPRTRKPRNPNPVNLKHSTHPTTGQSGAYYDPKEGVTKVFFGDDLSTHGAHLAYHDAKFPTHAGKRYKVAGGSSRSDTSGEWYKNGHEALSSLRGTPRAKDPKTGKPAEAFDEKPWASLSRENDHKISVVRVPSKESALEGSMSTYAKKVHKANPGSKGIKLIDNRTTKTALDPKLLLKKRDLLDDMKNKTESIIGDAKNKTEALMDDIQNDWASFQSKMASIIEPVLKDVDWVGDNFVGFLKQDTAPEDHQLGIFWHGMNSYDDVMAANANSSDPEDRAWVANSTNLAYEVAAMQLHNASSSKTEVALKPFLNALDEWNQGSDDLNSTATDDGSNSDDDSDSDDSDDSDSDDSDSDDSDDGSDDDSNAPSNGTAKATGNASMIPVNISAGTPTGTFAGAYATNSPKNSTAGSTDTTCTDDEAKTTPTQAPSKTTAAAVTAETTCTDEEAKTTSTGGVTYSSAAVTTAQTQVSSASTPAAATATPVGAYGSTR